MLIIFRLRQKRVMDLGFLKSDESRSNEVDQICGKIHCGYARGQSLEFCAFCGMIYVFWHPIGIERINGFENKDNLLRLRGTDIVNVLKERLTD